MTTFAKEGIKCWSSRKDGNPKRTKNTGIIATNTKKDSILDDLQTQNPLNIFKSSKTLAENGFGRFRYQISRVSLSLVSLTLNLIPKDGECTGYFQLARHCLYMLLCDLIAKSYSCKTTRTTPVETRIYRLRELPCEPEKPGCSGWCGSEPISNACNEPMLGSRDLTRVVVTDRGIDRQPQYRCSARENQLEWNQEITQLITQSICSQFS